jgi:hypothetical protein
MKFLNKTNQDLFLSISFAFNLEVTLLQGKEILLRYFRGIAPTDGLVKHPKNLQFPSQTDCLGANSFSSFFLNSSRCGYIILQLTHVLPSNTTNFISLVNTCYMFRSH